MAIDYTKKFDFIDINDCFETEPPELDFVLPGFLAGTVGGLVSPGGAGKSTFALLAAAAIADSVAGADLLELDIDKHGRVVFLAGEDPALAIRHRLFKLGSHLSKDQRSFIKENLHIAPCAGKGVDIDDSEWSQIIEEHAEGTRLMVIDTLTRFHSLDENSAQDAKKIMSLLEGIADRTGCSMLYLHHVNKAAATGGMADLQQAARGSSVFVDNARWLSFVACMTKDEAKSYGIDESCRHSYLRWNISKQNYSSPREDSWYQRHSGGILRKVELEKVEKIRKNNNGKRGHDNAPY